MEKIELPMLYGMSRLGKVKQWQAKVEMDEFSRPTIILNRVMSVAKLKSNRSWSLRVKTLERQMRQLHLHKLYHRLNLNGQLRGLKIMNLIY